MALVHDADTHSRPYSVSRSVDHRESLCGDGGSENNKGDGGSNAPVYGQDELKEAKSDGDLTKLSLLHSFQYRMRVSIPSSIPLICTLKLGRASQLPMTGTRSIRCPITGLEEDTDWRLRRHGASSAVGRDPV